MVGYLPRIHRDPVFIHVISSAALSPLVLLKRRRKEKGPRSPGFQNTTENRCGVKAI